MNDVETLITTIMKQFQDGGNGDVKGSSVRSPDKFTGKDRTKFRTFMAQLRLVFRANPRRYQSDTHKVTYACSYLDDIAFSWYENYVSRHIEPAWFNDYNAFERELSAHFGTINAAAAAERGLQRIKMRASDQVNDYLTRFAALRNDVDWNDSALVFAFKQGLPARIKDEIARNDLRPRDLTELIELVIRIDFQFWDRETERTQEKSPEEYQSRERLSSRPAYTSTPRTSNGSYAPRHPSLPYKPPLTSGQPPSRAPSKYPAGPRPVLSLNNEGKITNSERQRRMDNKLCLYCGGDHFLDKCDKKRSTNVRLAVPAASPEPDLHHVYALSEETYEYESGNE